MFACCGAVQRVVQELAGQVQVQVQGRCDQGDELLLLLRQDRAQEELTPRGCNKRTLKNNHFGVGSGFAKIDDGPYKITSFIYILA